MSAINDGGPAFPRTGYECTNGDWVPPQLGMTLRDWFAGQALAGISSTLAHEYEDRDLAERYAADAYELADAMLKAREVKP